MSIKACKCSKLINQQAFAFIMLYGILEYLCIGIHMVYYNFLYCFRGRSLRRGGVRAPRLASRRQQAGKARTLVQGRLARAHIKHALPSPTAPSAASRVRYQVNVTYYNTTCTWNTLTMIIVAVTQMVHYSFMGIVDGRK